MSKIYKIRGYLATESLFTPVEPKFNRLVIYHEDTY